eukprot:6491174-Amphidinium_carterae.2
MHDGRQAARSTAMLEGNYYFTYVHTLMRPDPYSYDKSVGARYSWHAWARNDSNWDLRIQE